MKIKTPEKPTGRQVAEALIHQGGVDPEAAYEHPAAAAAFDRQAREVDPDPVKTVEKQILADRLNQLGKEASRAAGVVLDGRDTVLTDKELEEALHRDDSLAAIR